MTDQTNPLTHAEIMRTDFHKVGVVLFAHDRKTDGACVVAIPQAIEPKFENLLRSSALLYQQLTRQYEALQTLIDACEHQGVTDLVPTFTGLQDAIMLAQRCAVEGPERVGLELVGQASLFDKLKKP